jgi:phospholipase C
MRWSASPLAAALSLALAFAAPAAAAPKPVTPIEHLVVIFQENVSFDHYFGTYPHAANLPGERPFAERKGTPSVNGFTPFLRFYNPNLANSVRLPPRRR